MNVEFTEQLFEAIDTLIRKSQEQQNIYDRTIVGKVLLIDQNGARFYIEDQSTRFYARGPADSAKYKANDQVYVLLPQGNYNNSVVVGKYNADDERAITYRGELDSIIDMTGNIFDPLDSLWQLDLRTPKVKEERFYREIKEEIKLNNSGSLASFGSFDYGIKDKKGFDYICLSAEIQTGDTLTIENQNGNYGLYFQVRFEKTGDLWYDFIFDSSQMIGNPYMYVGDFYKQSIVYKSDPTHGYPTDIKCILYAKDNFDFDGQVKIKNISCSFGYAQTDFSEDDILALYLKEGTKLYNNNNNDEQKILGIKWLHRNNSTGLMECYDSLRPAPIEVQYLVLKPEQLSSVKELTGLTNEELKEIQEVCKEYYNTLAQIEEAKENNEPIEELEEKKVSYLNQILEKQKFYETALAMPTNLNWYLYRPGETIDIGAGVYWGQLVNGEADNYSNYSKYDYLLGQNKYIKLQATDESDIVHSSIDLPVFDNMSTQFNVQIDTGKIESYEEEIEKTNDEGKITKEKITYLRMVENKLISDNFEFQSAEPRVDAVTSSYVKELMITCAQGTTFNIYGNDNKLYSSARRNLDLTVQYTNNKAISAAANIFWLIPKKSTMIQEPKEDECLSNNSSWWNILGTEITNKYYIIQEQGKNSTILTHTFNLKSSYNPVSNNYIECRIYEGQGDYKSGIISFNIGSTNNQNTEFSFNIVVDSYMVDLEEQSRGNKKENIPVSRHIFTNDTTGLLKLIGYPEGYSIISKKIIFKTELRNSKGELIAQDTPKWSYSDDGVKWSTEEENESLVLNANTTSCKIIKASTTITNTNNKNVNLVSYYLLPYTSELAYDLTDGDFNIIYNQFKTFPSGDTKYILYKNDIIQTSEVVSPDITNSYEDIIKSGWVIKKDEDNKEVPSEEYEIKLPGTPFQEGTAFIILKYNKRNNGDIIYQQPIRIDSLTISNFANWNGEIHVSGAGETAISMAPTFAAGSIDKNNNFTGVSMGKFQAGSNLAEGLYGFKQGYKSFSLNTNGEFFVGDNENYIEFTDNLAIKAKNFNLFSEHIEITTAGLKILNGGNFQIQNKNNESVLYFDSQNQQLTFSGQMMDPQKIFNVTLFSQEDSSFGDFQFRHVGDLCGSFQYSANGEFVMNFSPCDYLTLKSNMTQIEFDRGDIYIGKNNQLRCASDYIACNAKININNGMVVGDTFSVGANIPSEFYTDLRIRANKSLEIYYTDPYASTNQTDKFVSIDYWGLRHTPTENDTVFTIASRACIEMVTMKNSFKDYLYGFSAYYNKATIILKGIEYELSVKDGYVIAS